MGGDWLCAARAGRAAILALAVWAAALAVPARADDASACVSYADNAAKERAGDAGISNRYFSGEYALVFFAHFAAFIGGAPDGVTGVASISTHTHPGNGSQAVDVRFYGTNGCDLGGGS